MKWYNEVYIGFYFTREGFKFGAIDNHYRGIGI
jgi:hypothetical protein